MAQELLAVNAEISFEIYRATLAAGGVKRARLPKPLHITRPHERIARVEASTSSRRTRRHATTPEEVIAVLTAGHRNVKR